ncbi:MAG TPA: DUF4976 domain-containing protein, partial [Prolixibacteraceae bacterium]|nr:DUF4976 domain-containing protein [Prolixibacteraceae bacterium]
CPALTSLGENLAAVRSKQYRYIQYPDGTNELYDIRQDPYEWKNLVNEPGMDQVAKELRKYIPASFAKELPGIRRN